jgi:hypothetical protein
MYNIRCVGWTRHQQGTRVGFCDVLIPEIGLVINELPVFAQNGKRWSLFPAKAQISFDGQVMREPSSGKPKYISVMKITDEDQRRSFSAAVIDAVLKHNPRAFEQT